MANEIDSERVAVSYNSAAHRRCILQALQDHLREEVAPRIIPDSEEAASWQRATQRVATVLESWEAHAAETMFRLRECLGDQSRDRRGVER